MTTKEFDEVINSTLAQCKDTLINKAKEYATEDRLHNFRVASTLQDNNIEQSIAGMMAKHIISIYDMCNSGESYSMDMWQEKIGDAINYMLLLKAAVSEREEN